jgi:hypothetical protein
MGQPNSRVLIALHGLALAARHRARPVFIPALTYRSGIERVPL